MSTEDERREAGDCGLEGGMVEQAQIRMAAMRHAFESAEHLPGGVGGNFDCEGAIPKCREEVEALWLAVDDGCDVKLSQRLEAHFACCSSCNDHYEVEVRVRTLLWKKCRSEPCAPEGLKERLRDEIRNMLEISHPHLHAEPAE